MKLLFLNPPFKKRFSRSSRSPAVTKGGTLYFPIWLAYAAGVAEASGHHVQLIDAPAENVNLETVVSRLESMEPNMAIIDTSTPSIYNDVEVAAKIKKRFPNAFTVLAGTHPSALPQETLEINDNLDAVMVAEYEYTVRDLAHALENGLPLETVDGLVFRKNNHIVNNIEREKIKDLDELPFVSSVYKKHLDIGNYFFAAANYPMIMIMTGRGCPHRCFFCVYPQVFHGRYYRVRSAENVVDEFEYIRNHFPEVKEIGIEDDCFSANPKRVRRICDLIIERGIRIKWYCNVRGDVDFKLLRRMREAGCRLVTVGFESGCQEILDGMNKGERIDRYYRFARDARRAGIMVHGCIMVGNPGDNRDTLRESYRFAKEIHCDSMQFYPLYVYPGTEAFEWAKKKGYLMTQDFSKWLTKEGLHNCVISTPELSSSEMVCLCDQYLKRYHLRPRYLLYKFLQGIREPSEGYRTFKSARVLLSKIFAGHLGASEE